MKGTNRRQSEPKATTAETSAMPVITVPATISGTSHTEIPTIVPRNNTTAAAIRSSS